MWDTKRDGECKCFWGVGQDRFPFGAGTTGVVPTGRDGVIFCFNWELGQQVALQQGGVEMLGGTGHVMFWGWLGYKKWMMVMRILLICPEGGMYTGEVASGSDNTTVSGRVGEGPLNLSLGREGY